MIYLFDMTKEEKRHLICDFADHLNKSGHNIYDSDIDKFFGEFQFGEPEEKCPFCESENLFDIWMHHYRCKDCNVRWNK